MDRTCSVPGCGKALLAKGLCSMHYSRMRAHGTTDKAPQPPIGARRSSCVGQTFGLLTVLEMIYEPAETRVRCSCTCGGSLTALAYNVKNGNTRSCGCITAAKPKLPKDREAIRQREAERIRHVGHLNRTHGHTSLRDADGKRYHSKTYVSWADAKKRCYKPQNKRYPDYGGRGIGMCEAWRNSFAAFLADMGERPEGTTLDRIDVDGHYEPGNCRWATKHEQARNQRTNVATWEKVRAIRSEHAAGATPQALAAKYGMSDSNVYMIVQHKTWQEAA